LGSHGKYPRLWAPDLGYPAEGGTEVTRASPATGEKDDVEGAKSQALEAATLAIERALQRQAGLDSDRIERVKERLRRLSESE
jgi:hypothetical protein